MQHVICQILSFHSKHKRTEKFSPGIYCTLVMQRYNKGKLPVP